MKNWFIKRTILRVLYTTMGLICVGQALYFGEWIGVFFGGYFAVMGIFGWGCAGGNCAYEPSLPVEKTDKFQS